MKTRHYCTKTSTVSEKLEVWTKQTIWKKKFKGNIRALERAQRVQKVKQCKIRNIWNYIIVTIHENITTVDNNNNNQLIVWVSWKFLCWLTVPPFYIFHDKQEQRQSFGLLGITHKRQYMLCYLTKTKKKKVFWSKLHWHVNKNNQSEILNMILSQKTGELQVVKKCNLWYGVHTVAVYLFVR